MHRSPPPSAAKRPTSSARRVGSLARSSAATALAEADAAHAPGDRTPLRARHDGGDVMAQASAATMPPLHRKRRQVGQVRETTHLRAGAPPCDRRESAVSKACATSASRPSTHIVLQHTDASAAPAWPCGIARPVSRQQAVGSGAAGHRIGKGADRSRNSATAGIRPRLLTRWADGL